MNENKAGFTSWNRKTVAIVGAAAIGVTSGAFLAGRALAAGVPETEPLTYSGTLTDGSGTALSGDREILLRFWDAPEDGNVLCTRPQATVTLSLGRFTLPLPEACTDAVKENPDLWVEIVVDDVSLGLAKIGAVPFALEAGHAVTADRPNLVPLVHMVQDLADVRIQATLHPAATTWTPVTGRTLSFQKKYASSLLKVTYQDTLGTLGTRYGGCIWRILLDGVPISSFSAGDVGNAVALYGWKMDNGSHTAWATKAAVGKHTVTVEWRASGEWVAGGTDGVTECLVGWNTDGNFLSVEEIP